MEIDKNYITPADFSVIVKNIPQDTDKLHSKLNELFTNHSVPNEKI